MLLKVSRQWIIHCLIQTMMLEADSSIIFLFIIIGKSSLKSHKVEKLCGDFLLKCPIQGLFPLGGPQVNLEHLVFQPGRHWPGLRALAPPCLFFVCLAWLIQVTACYFLSKCCGWIPPPPPRNGTNLFSPRCVSFMRALHWQRTLGRAWLMNVALTVIWVVL